MPRFKVDMTVGRYRLLSQIGKGGNAEVWRATDAQHGDVAVKILTGSRRDARPRFRRELETQLGQLRGFDGLLPVIEGQAPDSNSELAWLAMPVAQPISGALGETEDLETTLLAVASLAGVLGRLHEAGYAHRDVKPGNLYLFDGKWVVGDLGLIAIPEPEALTVGARALGPRWFLAPEMLSSPETSAGPPADVYSLAKTLWVLLTHSEFAPPGTHHRDTPGLRPSSFVELERGAFLDRLMERATAYEPLDRPTASEFAAELRMIAEGLRPPERGEINDDEARREEFRLASERAVYDDDLRAARVDGGKVLLAELVKAGGGTYEELVRLGAPRLSSHFGRNRTVLDTANTWVVPHLEWAEGRCLVATLAYDTGLAGRRRGEIHLWSGFGVQVAADGGAILLAGHVVSGSVVWSESTKAAIGSMAARQAVTDLAEGLRRAVPEALSVLLRRYKRERPL